MHSRGVVHYSSTRDLPEDTLAQRLLRHTPRIERSERPNQIRHTPLLTGVRSGHGRVIEDRMNMGQIKVINICTKPRRQWPRVFERLTQLRLKEDRGHT